MNRARVAELNRERIKTLHPFIQLKAGEFLAQCEAALKLVVLVVSATRTFEEQERLFAKGRYGPDRFEKKVTWVKPGGSWHQYGLAFDHVPLKEPVSGIFTLDWDDEIFLGTAYQETRKVAEQIGFGLLPPEKDRPHLQWPGGWTTKELLALGYGKTKDVKTIPIPKPLPGGGDHA